MKWQRDKRDRGEQAASREQAAQGGEIRAQREADFIDLLDKSDVWSMRSASDEAHVLAVGYEVCHRYDDGDSIENVIDDFGDMAIADTEVTPEQSSEEQTAALAGGAATIIGGLILANVAANELCPEYAVIQGRSRKAS